RSSWWGCTRILTCKKSKRPHAETPRKSTAISRKDAKNAKLRKEKPRIIYFAVCLFCGFFRVLCVFARTAFSSSLRLEAFA
ncbi:MAG TPA: hypothetical protein VNX47_04640, partial [Nevskia sp.]|nr:hypothetical protein [Nevskia sp.]